MANFFKEYQGETQENKEQAEEKGFSEKYDMYEVRSAVLNELDKWDAEEIIDFLINKGYANFDLDDSEDLQSLVDDLELDIDDCELENKDNGNI